MPFHVITEDTIIFFINLFPLWNNRSDWISHLRPQLYTLLFCPFIGICRLKSFSSCNARRGRECVQNRLWDLQNAEVAFHDTLHSFEESTLLSFFCSYSLSDWLWYLQTRCYLSYWLVRTWFFLGLNQLLHFFLVHICWDCKRPTTPFSTLAGSSFLCILYKLLHSFTYS